MCGIAGFFKNDHTIDFSYAKKISENMSISLEHRGPDYLNQWSSESDDVFFSHSRLSILDLSSNGNQPMTSKSNRFVITYNGEIYNHLELRKMIDKEKTINWNSSCDTETLIESIDLFGIRKTLNLIEGMFAFAVWDKKDKKLLLARDQFGQKPLYYGFVRNSIVFGSELKALKCYPNFNNKLSRVGIGFYLDYSYIQEPDTIYEDIFKVKPSELIIFDLKKYNKKPFSLEKKEIQKIKWNLNNKRKNYKLSDETLKNHLETLEILLTKSVKETMLADVPVGCFLSGGIDSSLITAISQRISDKKIETFSIGFTQNEYDESAYAKKVSDYLGTNHNEYMIDPEKLYSIFDKVIDVYDEPFADSSQIPSIILSEFAKTKVKVVLTGDGADELFGGYNRYIYTNKIYFFLKFIPIYLRKKMSSYLFNSTKSINLFSKIINSINFTKYKIPQIRDKIEKFSIILKNSNDQMEIFFSLLKVNRELGNNIFSNSYHLKKYFDNEIKNILNDKNISSQNKMMIIDQNFYLNGDILHKVDRASMSVGLETRIPFLNSKIYDFSQNLPHNLKFKNGYGKWILRELSKKYIPEKIYMRKKMGFSIPLNKWIRLNSKKIKHNFIQNKDLLLENGINVESMNNYLKEHLDNKKDWSNYLWNIIVFERWLNKNKN